MKYIVIAVCLLLPLSNRAAENLQMLLTRMDAAAPQFHGIAANLQMVTHTEILNDNTTENGNLKMQRNGAKDVRAIIDFSDAKDPRIIAFLDQSVKIYFPRTKLVQVYRLGQKTDALNQYLLLGFGSSGKELAASYDVVISGSEKISGQNTSKLQLTPKDADVAEHVSKVEVWIPEGGVNPVQQKFFEPSGNYRQVTYSNLQPNTQFGKRLELIVPKGVQEQHP